MRERRQTTPKDAATTTAESRPVLIPVGEGTFKEFSGILDQYNCLVLSAIDPKTGEETPLSKELECKIGGQCVEIETFDDRPTSPVWRKLTHITRNNEAVDLETDIYERVGNQDNGLSVSTIKDPSVEDVIQTAKRVLQTGTITIVARTPEEYQEWVRNGSPRVKEGQFFSAK